MVKKQEIKIRDKQITSRRLISAVGSILGREGFKGIGVNAVAREAGVDKVLIYRYFGGLQGLMAAISYLIIRSAQIDFFLYPEFAFRVNGPGSNPGQPGSGCLEDTLLYRNQRK